MNLANMTLLAMSLPVAQWLERPTGVTGGHGFDSCRGLRFFVCPTLMTTEYSIFLISFRA